MTLYKGMDIADEFAALIPHMHGVEATREALQALQSVWDTLTLLGEFSGAGVEIGSLRSAFADLSAPLLNQLVREARSKAVQKLRMQAQVSIDILVRNLFERTADIGFLAMDDDLRRFVAADDAERARTRGALLQRLRAYQTTYSVYDDIVLFDANGTILLRLDDDGTQRSDDALIGQALRQSAAYLETFATSDLQPRLRRSLNYSCRVAAAQGSASAVLSLRFDFEDECRRIFAQLVQPNDWTVLMLLDAEGQVIASSDVLQVPIDARLVPVQSPKTDVVRFAGRRWLSVGCEAHAYQGYAGPGWHARTMTPLEHAFDAEPGTVLDALPPAVLRALMDSPLLFNAELRRIPQSAEHIEIELHRAVWNGSVAEAGRAGQSAGRDAGFSRALLREIARTGARTRDVFTGAIAAMNHTVISSTLDDGRARAALAIDIMDRNLYERANDCRWWALTATFREALGTPDIDPAQRDGVRRTLQAIHGLYTVYANLVLFDRQGRIVAASKEDGATACGRQLSMAWVRQTLSASNPQAYTVSAFEPSDLYAGQSTYVYCAAVRSLGRGAAAVGGIAIVFDSATQFRAMLDDVLPHNAQGTVLHGAAAAFVTAQGGWIAQSGSSETEGAGSTLWQSLDVAALRVSAVAQPTQVATIDGRLYAVGVCPSTGYREYKGPTDSYRNDVLAVVLQLMSDQAPAAGQPTDAGHNTAPKALSAKAGGATAIELATFSIADQWFALPAAETQEAIGVSRLLPLPGAARSVGGSVMLRDEPIAVLDLHAVLQSDEAAQSRSPERARHIVVLREKATRRRFGLLVDALGPMQTVPLSHLDALSPRGDDAHALVLQIVKPTPDTRGGPLLMVLSLERLYGLIARKTDARSADAVVGAETASDFA